MFGIGFSEILVIVIILFVFIRPEDLPKIMRAAGKYYGKAKKLYNELIQVKDKIMKEIDEAAALEEQTETKKLPDNAGETAGKDSAQPESANTKENTEEKKSPDPPAA